MDQCFEHTRVQERGSVLHVPQKERGSLLRLGSTGYMCRIQWVFQLESKHSPSSDPVVASRRHEEDVSPWMYTV